MSHRRFRLAPAIAVAALTLGACSGSEESVTATEMVVSSVEETTPDGPGGAAPRASGDPAGPDSTPVVDGTAAPSSSGPRDETEPNGRTGAIEGIPSYLSRDDVNVDARDFETAPGVYHFRSPSGNVWCAIRTDGMKPEFGCQAEESVVGSSGVECRNAENHSYAVRIEGGEVVQFCTSQGIFTAPSPRTLEYGQVIMVMSDVCASTKTAITCYARDGFALARDVNQVLPGP